MEDFNYLESFRKEVEEIRSVRLGDWSRQRKQKRFKKRINPMEDFDNEEFRLRYRFSKENMQRIVDLIKHEIHVDKRGAGISADLAIMAVIRYWGRHEIQEGCANIHGISQQSLSKLCMKVGRALASKCPLLIKMPSTETDEARTMEKFEAFGLPQIIGAIDSTHIKIRKVGGDAGQFYVNSKGHYSINTQVVCNADLEICDIVCHWGGSTDDARIFHESPIKRRFEEGEFGGKLIGDSEYPYTSYLLTPLLRPTTTGENLYNVNHIRTRSVIERCFGMWKQRFRILLEVMRGSLTNIKTTIVACAVLHNLAIEFDEEVIEDFLLEEVETEVVEEHRNQQILGSYFS